MNEVKPPKKPLIYYYFIVMLALVLFNLLAMPLLSQSRIRETDYGTFLTMIENGEVGEVEINEQENKILFTDKAEETIYQIGMVNDPDLTQRLHDAGVPFNGTVMEQESPLLTFFLSWILPLVLFAFVGQMLYSQLMKKAGGQNSMMFGMGKSNAKVYVKSAEGIRFSDVAGEDEAKENLTEIVDYLHDPKKYEEIGASMPKGILLVCPPGTGKTMLAKAVAG